MTGQALSYFSFFQAYVLFVLVQNGSMKFSCVGKTAVVPVALYVILLYFSSHFLFFPLFIFRLSFFFRFLSFRFFPFVSFRFLSIFFSPGASHLSIC